MGGCRVEGVGGSLSGAVDTAPVAAGNGRRDEAGATPRVCGRS